LGINFDVEFRLNIFNPPSQKSFCNNSFLTLCTGELHIKVKISSFTSYIKENVVNNKFWKDVFHAWNTFIDKEENFTWEYFGVSSL
jgi:hypothetical protein